MQTFDDIVTENINLLIEKGYDHKSIRSFDSIQLLTNRFAVAFSKDLAYEPVFDMYFETYREFEERLQKDRGFGIGITGYFNRDKDIVQFGFDFQKDETTGHVKLTDFYAHLDSVSITHKIGRTISEMPEATATYKALVTLRTEKIGQMETEQKKKHPVSSKQQRNIKVVSAKLVRELADKDYLSKWASGINNCNNFYLHLKNDLLVKRENPADWGKSLAVITTERTGQDDKYSLSTRFAIEYRPESWRLHITAIDARINDERALVFPKANEPVPYFDDLYWRLSEKQSIQEAKRIYEYESKIRNEVYQKPAYSPKR